jgi:hypothetical protein
MGTLHNAGMEQTPLSRPDPSVITANTRARFDAAAQAVRPLLITRLRRAGAGPEDAEDVAQEALLRAWDRHIPFEDDGDLLRWCTVVARRAHIDRVRRQVRLMDLGEIVSDAACRDLEAVELRHVLGTVAGALTLLTERERSSLRPSASPDRRTQIRAAVARHRARARLRLLVGPFAAGLAAAARVVRRGVPAATAVGALAAAVVVVGGGIGTPGSAGPRRPAPPAATVVDVASVAHAAGLLAAAPRQQLAGPAPRAPRPHRVVPAPARPPIVKMDGPAQTRITATQRPPTPDDHIFCLDDSVAGKVCVG